jgi:hypothetical protein
MSVERFLFLLLVAAAAAQQMPSCPASIGKPPTEVDSPCGNGCRYACGDALCQLTITTNAGMTTRSVNCGNEAWKPFCPQYIPTVSTTQFCTSGCKFFCRGGSQNALCTMTLTVDGWSVDGCTPLPTKTGATDCSASQACISQVGACPLFTRKCSCFADGSFESAGCFRTDTVPAGPSAPTPLAPAPTAPPTPQGPAPTPQGQAPTPQGQAPTPLNAGETACPGNPTCVSFWPGCRALTCICRNGQLAMSNCNDPTPAPFVGNPQTPAPFVGNPQTPSPFVGNPQTPFPPVNQGTPIPPVVQVPGAQPCRVATLCDSYLQGGTCTIATGAQCQCDAQGNVVSKTCPAMVDMPCNMNLPNIKDMCDLMRTADGGICTVAQGGQCTCNASGGILSKTCRPSISAPLKEGTCTGDLLLECEAALTNCGTRKKLCECASGTVTNAMCRASSVSVSTPLALFAAALTSAVLLLRRQD